MKPVSRYAFAIALLLLFPVFPGKAQPRSLTLSDAIGTARVQSVQPLFAYNPFKWDKLIEPKEYERGRRRYIESMEQVTIRTVSAYFRLIAAFRNFRSSYLSASLTLHFPGIRKDGRSRGVFVE